MLEEFGPRGLRLLLVVVEDTAGKTATNDYCLAVEETLSLKQPVYCDPDALIEPYGKNGLVVLLDASLRIFLKKPVASMDYLHNQLEAALP